MAIIPLLYCQLVRGEGRVRYLHYQMVFRYSGILPVMPGRAPRYPEHAGRERGRGRGGVVSVHQRGIWQKEKIFRFCMVLSAIDRGIGDMTGRVGAFSGFTGYAVLDVLPSAFRVYGVRVRGALFCTKNFLCVFRVYGVRMGVVISI